MLICSVLDLLDFSFLIKPGVLGDLFGRFLFRSLNLGFFSYAQLDWVTTIDQTITLENLCAFCIVILRSMSIVILNSSILVNILLGQIPHSDTTYGVRALSLDVV